MDSKESAAKQSKVYHLWWHPHNFGANLEENVQILEKILSYYRTLHERHGFESHSMQSLAESTKKKREKST